MRWHLWLVIAAVSTTLWAQEQDVSVPEVRVAPPIIAGMQTPVKVPARPVIADGTGVWLRMNSEAKVKRVKIGDKVDFVLYKDLYYRDTLLAKAGTPVEATVKHAAPAKLVQRGSKLVITMQALKLLNGQLLPLRGDASFKGSHGTGGTIAGGMLEVAAHCNAAPCILYDVPALPIAGLIALFTHGENRNIKLNTSAVAFVDGEFKPDMDSLREFQPPPAVISTAGVQIVRGRFGAGHSRDLYCNGVPMAHLGASKKLELELKPGYYRFAINPKRRAFEIYLRAGSQVVLLTDADWVEQLREHDVNINTVGLASSSRNAEKLLKKASPVNKANVYATECNPLPEETIQQPEDGPTAD